ncbi:MAG: hypothetical protein JNM27_13355 [Leptospirales bacterium]|nr:hypothetical protein [Leptospirales bacterium]
MGTKHLLIAAALSGLMSCASAAQNANGPKSTCTPGADKACGECYGINSCKGTGECGGADGGSCKGTNSCKGKGYLHMTLDQCKTAAGTFKKGNG